MTDARWMWAARASLGALVVIPFVLAGSTLDARAPAAGHGPGPSSVLPPPPGASDADSVLLAAAARAPFRPSGAASAVSYDPVQADPALAVPVSRPPRPSLALSGLVYGARPGAVVEGIPGRDGGVVLLEGDTIAGLRLRRIAIDHVVITGFDTMWTLEVRRPW